MVTHLSTNLTIYSLDMGERTGSLVFYNLWPYVKTRGHLEYISSSLSIFSVSASAVAVKIPSPARVRVGGSEEKRPEQAPS